MCSQLEKFHTDVGDVGYGGLSFLPSNLPETVTLSSHDCNLDQPVRKSLKLGHVQRSLLVSLNNISVIFLPGSLLYLIPEICNFAQRQDNSDALFTHTTQSLSKHQVLHITTSAQTLLARTLPYKPLETSLGPVVVEFIGTWSSLPKVVAKQGYIGA